MGKVRVVVRLRPDGGQSVCGVYGGAKGCHATSVVVGQTPFDFDAAFGATSTQADVYAATAAPLVSRVLNGRNGTVLAYGPTGTGKTHTVLGREGEPGLLPLVLDATFAAVRAERAAGVHVRVVVSYLEVYNEAVRDLFADDPTAELAVRADPKGGVKVVGLSEVECADAADAADCVAVGTAARTAGATGANANSSRSHAIFEVRVETRAKGSATTASGRLLVVDLAGSECAERTGAFAEGSARRLEAQSINQSLLALGQVITALASKKGGHVPFRDSKLTRLLHDSLGGSAETVLVACISPGADARDETLSTLRYADKARCIESQDRAHVAPPRAPDAETLAAAERALSDAEEAIEAATLRLAEETALLEASINDAVSAHVVETAPSTI
ncbi:P-loop containing nucleoside triphosphate hydrolase protein [Pelagophyceae sp. CCMP2097]|nr:P-loop containing nucleoside triphosphate hydrolase protein [Pelagophyceae sp. CCMP2097]